MNAGFVLLIILLHVISGAHAEDAGDDDRHKEEGRDIRQGDDGGKRTRQKADKSGHDRKSTRRFFFVGRAQQFQNRLGDHDHFFFLTAGEKTAQIFFAEVGDELGQFYRDMGTAQSNLGRQITGDRNTLGIERVESVELDRPQMERGLPHAAKEEKHLKYSHNFRKKAKIQALFFCRLPRVILFGAQGMVGQELFALLAAQPEVYEAIPLSAFNCDLRDAQAVSTVIAEIRPEIVINAAAFSDVDACEDPRCFPEALAVNAAAPGVMAEACRKAGARFVHFSTDFVFDGSQESYRETDQPRPINAYGETKLRGEIAVSEADSDALIMRTARVFGRGRPNFVSLLDFLARKNKPIRAITDERGNYTYAPDLARRVLDLLAADEGLKGIVHLTGSETASPYEVAVEVVRLRQSASELLPITAASLGRPAARPPAVAMESMRIEPLAGYHDSLPRFLAITEQAEESLAG